MLRGFSDLLDTVSHRRGKAARTFVSSFLKHRFVDKKLLAVFFFSYPEWKTFGSMLTELQDRWSHKLISQTHERHVERSFSSRLNRFPPSAVTGGVPQGLVMEPPANWGWAKSHTFDVLTFMESEKSNVYWWRCKFFSLPPVKLLKCFITTNTYPHGSVRAEAPLKGQRSWAEAAASPPNMFEFLLFCQGRAVRRTFSCSSLCWFQQLIIDRPVAWTCTLLQHQNSGNVSALMVLFVKKARRCSGIILNLQNHPFLTCRRQSSSDIPEKVGSADSSRSDMNPDQTADLGFGFWMMFIRQHRHQAGTTRMKSSMKENWTYLFTTWCVTWCRKKISSWGSRRELQEDETAETENSTTRH